MPELIILLVIALLVVIVFINRKDRKDIEAFVLEGGVKERLEKLMKSEEEYKNALRNSDKDRARDLGRKYYKEKTDYEYWEAAVEPCWDMENVSENEKYRINKEIKNRNLKLRKSIVAKNDRALACDMKAMKNQSNPAALE
ncbi:MAG: hypothetical protein IPN92_05720 [Chromatiaceae bacterium]|nr:hypothetical protein [Chromatiaceae bacterium]